MTRRKHTSSGPIVLLILFGTTQQLYASNPLVNGGRSDDGGNIPSPLGLARLFSSQVDGGQFRLDKEKNQTQALPEEEDELFKDVDPKMLAAVLLEALNTPGEATKSIRAGGSEENERGAEEEGKGRDEAALSGSDRDRDRAQELELVMAAAEAEGRTEREREEEEEEERKRAEEEEERLTEKVKSRTTSQNMQAKEQPEKKMPEKEQETREEEERQEPADEEQLSSQEVKNLQAVLQELQSYSTAAKRQQDSEAERESRGAFLNTGSESTGNEIKPKPKGYQLALSKKKLKWQEEEEKKKNRPLYRGGNFMDEFEDMKGQDGQDEEGVEDEEEALSPQEEEARAKADQEEVRRQAVEAQRVKAEEERLADIASDMLLQYMVKHDGKKYEDQSEKTSRGSNAVEDKRSEEEDENDNDDIDPRTIDKLIEISSKLHLPADDVVDIISDVEKKKKKDAPENVPWRLPLAPPPAPAPASAPKNAGPKVQNPVTTPTKAGFKEASAVMQSKQDFWPKLQKPFRTYPTYSFVQQPRRGYFPIYFPPPKPKPRYYAKPALSFNNYLGKSRDYDFGFPPKRRYQPWAQLRSQNPLPLRRNLYLSNFVLPRPRTFQPAPVPKPRSPLRRRPIFYFPPPARMVTRSEDYFDSVEQQQGKDKQFENFLEKVFRKHPGMFQ